MRKKTKILLVCTLLILVSLSLMGCGLFQSDTMKLKRLLKDKYGENFVVKEHHYEGDMIALCYPRRDSTLLFEVRTDAAVTKIMHDYYLQTVVQRQLDEAYAPLVEQAFPGSYLSSYISHTLSKGPNTLPKADSVTMDDLIRYCDENEYSLDIIFHIFVDASQMKEENIEAEYAFLTDEIGKRIARGELPDTFIDFCFGDETFVQECEELLAITTWNDDDIYYKIEDCPKICIVYRDNGEVACTLDKYREKRTEALEILLQG